MQFKLSKAGHYKGNYVEAGQTIPIKYAYAKVEGNTVHMLHNEIQCRDYLLDTVLWEAKAQKNGDQRVWGYAFSERDPDHYDLLLSKCPHLKENFHLLNKIEEDNGFKPSTLYETDTPGWLLLRGDVRLQQKTELLSLHTLYLRFMSHKKVTMDDVETEIRQYLGTKGKKLLAYVEKYVKGRTNNAQAMKLINDKKHVGGEFHNTIGIQYFCNTLKHEKKFAEIE